MQNNNKFYYSKKNLDLVSSVIFLRNVIIDKNKNLALPLNFNDFENIKIEYAHLRVDLLNEIKTKFSFRKYEEKCLSLN